MQHRHSAYIHTSTQNLKTYNSRQVMMQISKNFTLEEFERSAAAAANHINNTASPDIIKNIDRLVHELLQPVRNEWGKPMHINSGYRSAALNDIVGGALNSFHCRGLAADIRITTSTEGRIMAAMFLQRALCDLVILERSKKSYWLHVQLSDTPRHKYLEITKSKL